MEKIKAYLGIDIGSVSTNLVVLDEKKELLARRYLPTAGRPIEAVRHGLAEIGKEIGDKIEILGVGTTGSGRYMLGELLGADLVKNEISAQAEGALHYDPAVDTIFEIGGQDSKYISLDRGVIVDFTMNKACAAGTGSFLEEQAEKLGINIMNEFADLALSADKEIALGDRCTVFIDSELNHYLQKGASRGELAAGLAVSIVKNYLNKVVENRRVGNNIFFQGGVASNRAVVEAFRKVTGKPITVPPNHDITGAVGIALLTMKARSWKESGFKGFDLAGRKYEVSTFECKSCANLCEVNRVVFENESPAFFGGRCEKYEKKVSPDFHLLPDLFRERDDIIFGKPARHGLKKIGIPRVLFFFERYPFWKAFFSSLGFEVVISDASNAAMAEDSFECITAEACFPITLAHGHIKNLLEKGIDYLFLPSLIDAEKASDKFTQHFNCPFVQALPYFIRSGFDFDNGVKVLTPPLEPQRGKRHLKKQLIKLGKELGRSGREISRAISKAGSEFEAAQQRLREKGAEALEWIERHKVPALVIISRPYNGSDPVLNLNIPQKLREMGIVAIPMDLLPIHPSDAAHDYPNLYWDCGQKIVAAAKFIERHPTLHAIHITNFRCGPDSFISHLIRAEIRSKPFLQIEVDGHSSDTGMVTRIEAYLDSINNRKAHPHRKAVEKSPAYPLSELKKRTVYIMPMCDHAHPLAAAFRAAGFRAEVLPPSDEKTLELGRKFTSGKECHPYTVTTGDILKKANEPGFDAWRSAFLIPTASGPCRFGQYQQAQNLLFRQIGYEDILLFSPDVKDSYGRSTGLGMDFRRRVWQGVVASDLLDELTSGTRPYEKEEGAIDRLARHHLERICRELEKDKYDLKPVIREMKRDFAAMPLTGSNHKPLIGIVGEIFLRLNPRCNGGIVKKLEEFGGVTRTAPISEWIYYTGLGYIYESWMRKKFGSLLQALAADAAQRLDERRLGYRQPSALKLIRKAAPYLHYSFKGEAVLTIGKAIDLIEHGASGIVNIMPFTCMPGTVVAAAARKLREDHPGIPWLDVSIDGNEGVNLETRLEAFMHQASCYNEVIPIPRK